MNTSHARSFPTAHMRVSTKSSTYRRLQKSSFCLGEAADAPFAATSTTMAANCSGASPNSAALLFAYSSATDNSNPDPTLAATTRWPIADMSLPGCYQVKSPGTNFLDARNHNFAVSQSQGAAKRGRTQDQ